MEQQWIQRFWRIVSPMNIRLWFLWQRINMQGFCIRKGCRRCPVILMKRLDDMDTMAMQRDKRVSSLPRRHCKWFYILSRKENFFLWSWWRLLSHLDWAGYRFDLIKTFVAETWKVIRRNWMHWLPRIVLFSYNKCVEPHDHAWLVRGEPEPGSTWMWNWTCGIITLMYGSTSMSGH